MVVILVHIGKELPVYINDCIKQLRVWGNKDIVLVTDECNKRFESALGVWVMPIEKYEDDPKIKRYNELEFFKPKGSFWDVTCKRLFYVECVMRDMKLNEAWHIENDNLVFCNLEEEARSWRWHDNQVIITQCTEEECTANIMLVNSISALSVVTSEMLKLMKLGFQKLVELYKFSHIGEMRLLNILAEKVIPNYIYYFPILNKDCSCNLYDPASYGQMLDGVPSNPGVPGIFDVHIIGKYILSLPEEERRLIQLNDSDGRKIYKFRGDKLMNLHMHSKRLDLWM